MFLPSINVTEHEDLRGRGMPVCAWIPLIVLLAEHGGNAPEMYQVLRPQVQVQVPKPQVRVQVQVLRPQVQVRVQVPKLQVQVQVQVPCVHCKYALSLHLPM